MIRCPASWRLVRPADLVGAGTDGAGAGGPCTFVDGGAVDADGDATHPPPDPLGADQSERVASRVDGRGAGARGDWQATIARPSAPAARAVRILAAGYTATST